MNNWLLAEFSAGELADPTISGDFADFDGGSRPH
jgi:hypothetical protein